MFNSSPITSWEGAEAIFSMLTALWVWQYAFGS